MSIQEEYAKRRLAERKAELAQKTKGKSIIFEKDTTVAGEIYDKPIIFLATPRPKPKWQHLPTNSRLGAYIWGDEEALKKDKSIKLEKWD